jgi:hypothetical protein
MAMQQDELGNWYDDGEVVGAVGDPSDPTTPGNAIVAEDGTIIYKQPDGTYLNDKGEPVGSNGEITPTVNVPIDSNDPWAAISGQLKKLYTSGPNGTPDIGKIATLAALASGMMQSTNRTQPAGYQGKIPTLAAVRQQVPQGIAAAPRAYGAPAMGRRYFTDTQYVAPTGLAAAQDAAQQQAQQMAAAQQPQQAQPIQAAKGGLVSDGFVIPADVISHLGNGSSEAGLKVAASRLGATPIKGKGDGMSDSIKTHIDGKQPARVANEEAFVSPKKVAELGGGDPKKGSKKLYDMMDKIRAARTGTKEQGKQIDPSKYMPGGEVGYATGGTTLPAGTTGTESNLSNWAGDYVTGMLGQGQALANTPYQAYTGQLTAGTSPLQDKVFTGLQGVNFPTNLGQSFTSAGAPIAGTAAADGTVTGGTAGQGIASQYMNPYLKNVLDPQMAELQRQNQIANMNANAKLTGAGAYGGGRQAVMNAENQRNMMSQMNKTLGEGYASAYDKAMQQFNTEQGQAKTLTDMLAQAGTAQRGIESEALAADKAQFEEERANPYKMVQFQQSLLQGLPLAAQTYNQAPTNILTNAASNATTMNALLKSLGIIQ